MSASRSTSSRPLLLFLLSTLLVAFGSGCLKRDTNVTSGHRDQILHRGIGPDLADLDPHLAVAAGDYNVLSALFEGLVAEDPVDLHPVPGVAERWDISSDQLTYTFHLRADARWSNGDTVTAQDFVASLRRMLAPELGADNAAMLYVIQGAEAFHKGRTDFSRVGVAAPDARTLRLTLEQPTPAFLAMLNHQAWFPIHFSSIEKIGPPTHRSTAWATPERLVGNGPFVLKEWRRGQKIVVEKSPTYWDAANVRLNGIHFHTIDSVDAEERAFRSGQLHLTEALPVSKVDAYRRDAPHLLRIDPLLGTYFFRLNVTRPFLNEPRVRRALALAVDREAIVEKVLRGGQMPAYAFTPPGIGDYTSAAQISTDFEEARRLLTEAGYAGGRGLPTFELLFNTSENHRLIAEAVQEMWRRELGVEVRLANQEWKSTLESRRTGNYQILRSVWTADYLDPFTFLSVWTSDSGNNHTGWSNPTYDALLREATLTPDPAARSNLFQRAEALLLEGTPLIPVYHYTHVFLIHPSVQGWHPTPLDHHPYKHVWLEPAAKSDAPPGGAR